MLQLISAPFDPIILCPWKNDGNAVARSILLIAKLSESKVFSKIRGTSFSGIFYPSKTMQPCSFVETCVHPLLGPNVWQSLYTFTVEPVHIYMRSHHVVR